MEREEVIEEEEEEREEGGLPKNTPHPLLLPRNSSIKLQNQNEKRKEKEEGTNSSRKTKEMEAFDSEKVPLLLESASKLDSFPL